MFKKILSLSKDTVIYGFGYFLSRFLAFLLTPFYTHLITAAEFGYYNLLYMFIAIMQVVYIGGLDIAFLRFYVGEDDETQRRTFSNSFLGMFLLGAGLTVFFFVFARQAATVVILDPPPEAVLWIRIACAILFIDSLNTIPLFKLRGDKKPVAFATITVLKVAANIGANIYLVGVLKMGITGILWANLFSSSFAMLLLMPVFLSKFNLKLRLKVLGELWRFGIPNVPALLLFFVIEFSGRKILEVTHGEEMVGLYSAGHRLGMFMAIVTNAFRFAWQPFFLAEAKNEGAEQTFARVFTYYFAVASILFLLFVMFAVDLVKMRIPFTEITVINEAFWGGLVVFPMILMSHFFDGIYANFSVGVYIKKLTRLIPLIMGITAVFNLTANLIFIPRYGMLAAAWVALVSYALMALVQYSLINRHYPVPYEWGRVIKIAVPCGLVAAAFFIHPGTVIWRLGLLAIIPVFLYILGFFTESEKERIMKVLRLLK